MGQATVNLQNLGRLVSVSNALPVVISSPSSTATEGAVSTVSFVRTADVVAYSANDVIGINAAGVAGSAIHTFALAGPAGGNVIVTGWDLTIDATAIPAGMTTFLLHLYDASPTAIVDNAAFNLVTADQLKHLAVLDNATMVDYGNSLFGATTKVDYQLKLASSVTSLFGQLVTNAAFTPASGTAFQIRLRTRAI